MQMPQNLMLKPTRITSRHAFWSLTAWDVPMHDQACLWAIGMPAQPCSVRLRCSRLNASAGRRSRSRSQTLTRLSPEAMVWSLLLESKSWTHTIWRLVELGDGAARGLTSICVCIQLHKNQCGHEQQMWRTNSAAPGNIQSWPWAGQPTHNFTSACITQSQIEEHGHAWADLQIASPVLRPTHVRPWWVNLQMTQSVPTCKHCVCNGRIIGLWRKQTEEPNQWSYSFSWHGLLTERHAGNTQVRAPAIAAQHFARNSPHQHRDLLIVSYDSCQAQTICAISGNVHFGCYTFLI